MSGRPSAEPRATMRLQLHRGFGFDDARSLLPYLQRLGISHVFASPILSARPGSLHGYDVIDHGTVNPEIGGEDGLCRLVEALRARGMGLIVDIVPNHMAVDAGNPRWLDVLEWGQASDSAEFFDIDWEVPDPAIRGRVLAPFLGRPYGEALAGGEIQLRFDPQRGRFHFAYYEHRFPLAAAQYAPLLRTGETPLATFAESFVRLSRRGGIGARRQAFETACAALTAAAGDAAVRRALDALLELHAVPREAAAERLHRLLERQHYRLAWWRTAGDEINWRRFFDISELAGLRIEEPSVFEIVHAKTFGLYAAGLIDGLRIDHVDGLADPRAYCRRLRARLTELEAQRPAQAPPGPAYVVVEKILAPGELLARDWRVDGTSGYSFMNEVCALMHEAEGAEPLTALWRGYSGGSGDFAEEERRARRRIPQDLFSADFGACAQALHRIARADPATRDWTLAAVRRVLAELLVHFPVYRTYADARGRSAADAAIMQRVVADAQRSCRPTECALVELIDRWLGGEPPAQAQPPALRRLRLRALARFQQLTSPVAAKSVEDTAFYRHGRLISRNEVGADPGQFSMSVDAFHDACALRLRRYPRAMLATATHDHKRGEDVRARLSVLSEMPQRWGEAARAWSALNAPLRTRLDGFDAPDAIDEYILYQTLVGSWPPTLRIDDADALGAYRARLSEWQRKAVREAKRRSGWTEPNAGYEEGCERFLEGLLDPPRSAQFLESLRDFVATIAAAGAVKGLAQALLRITTPGVPDLYQGTEFWDFSMVDPDNRRSVDFAARIGALDMDDGDAVLLRDWADGRVKQRLIARALRLRGTHGRLFARGRYLPLQVSGTHARAFVAFARVDDQSAVAVVAPRLAGNLLAGEGLRLAASALGDTCIDLPGMLATRGWHSALGTEPRALTPAGSLSLAALLDPWPVALLVSTA